MKTKVANSCHLQVSANEPGGTRTHDLRIKSPLLYQLSYELEHWKGGRGSARKERKRPFHSAFHLPLGMTGVEPALR